MSSIRAPMEAGKILDVFGSQPGYVIQQAEAKQAYTQETFQSVATGYRETSWPQARQDLKGPVVPLNLGFRGLGFRV